MGLKTAEESDLRDADPIITSARERTEVEGTTLKEDGRMSEQVYIFDKNTPREKVLFKDQNGEDNTISGEKIPETKN